eukprot:gene3205-3681_t
MASHREDLRPVVEGNMDGMESSDEETRQLLEAEDQDSVNVTVGSYKSIGPTTIGLSNDHDEKLAHRRRIANQIQRSTRTSSFADFRGASLSISMLAKPSDDRYASALLAGWNVSNLIQGTGILGIPFAVHQGGWAAVASMFIVAAICCYTGKLLINCLYEESKKTRIKRRLRVNYPEVAEAVFKRPGFRLVAAVQVFEMFGGVTMYVVLLGTVLGELLHAKTGLGTYEWAVISCVLALPSLFIKRMSIISWFSLMAVFALMGSLFVMMAFAITKYHMWKLSNIPAFNPSTFPIGFGIVVFSYCAHAVFPSIESSMRKPQQFNAMMNWAFALAAIVKALLGVLMVLAFGDDTREVATVNLLENAGFSITANALVITNVMLAIPLVMYVVSESFDDAMLQYFPHLNKDSKYHWVWLLMTRPMLLCCALFIAIIVPHFGLLMGFVGSFTGTCLCFIFPCWFYLKLRWHKISKWVVALNICIMVFGAVAGCFGLYFSARALGESFKFEN